MNTLEMLQKVNKGFKYRLATWFYDETARIEKDTLNNIPVVASDSNINEPFQLLNFLDVTDWVEYMPTLRFSQLKQGEEFSRVEYHGTYVKLNPVYMGDFNLHNEFVYFNTSTHYLHADYKDFLVQKV